MRTTPQAVSTRLPAISPVSRLTSGLGELTGRRRERERQRLEMRERLRREGRRPLSPREQLDQLGWPRP